MLARCTIAGCILLLYECCTIEPLDVDEMFDDVMRENYETWKVLTLLQRAPPCMQKAGLP